MKDTAVGSFKRRERIVKLWAAFEEDFEMGWLSTRRFDVTGLQIQSSKGATPELGQRLWFNIKKVYAQIT